MSTSNRPLDATAVIEAARHDELHTFAFQGSGSSLFALILKNVALTLVTLGIYLPWAKTERRKYIWQNVEVDGHRLRYHGTGQELLIGYLKVVLGYLLFVGIAAISRAVFSPTVAMAVQGLLALLILPLIPYAIWGSQRYLLSRTSWRGIHFRLAGSPAPFVKLFFGGYLLTLITLGVYGPVWINDMRRLLTNASGLGTRSFDYRADNKQAWRLSIKGFVLSLLTAGLYTPWYAVAMARFRLRNTWLDGAHGELQLTGTDMLLLTLLQVFGTVLSLGLAFPWITAYSMQFVLQRTRFVGPVDFARIYQAPADGTAMADGLADMLDVGSAL